MKNIVIFASGGGTNALNIIRHFKQKDTAKVVGVFCNVPGAGVIEKAEKEGVPVQVFTKEELRNGEGFDEKLQALKPDVIVLAGFLWLFPERLLKLFPNRVVNIHPALLPAYGGKGMYGDKVHSAVMANGERIHGVTVHVVNEEYDKGEILAQESFEILPGDSMDSILQKIHEIEYRIYPIAIENLLGKLS